VVGLSTRVPMCLIAFSIVLPLFGSADSGPGVPEAAAMAQPAANTLIWDTISPLVDELDLQDRAKWKAVPTDLLTLELDPSKATSDPAHYGREYRFKGDTVVENSRLIAVFRSKKGRVAVQSKPGSSRNKVEFVPLRLRGKPATIADIGILQNTGNEAALEVSFSAGQTGDDVSAVFSFASSEIVGIKPDENMKGITLFSPIEYGVLPDFIADDLIFDPAEYPSTDTLSVPSENLFLGLLEGQSNMLVVTWPAGKQQMKLLLGDKEPKHRLIESLDFENDGKSIYLALLAAPGIWHKEELKPSYLEKDVAVTWKRPFPAKWKTQLLEAGVKTTYTFRESRNKIWRAII